jgi:hypothetical protein
VTHSSSAQFFWKTFLNLSLIRISGSIAGCHFKQARSRHALETVVYKPSDVHWRAMIGDFNWSMTQVQTVRVRSGVIRDRVEAVVGPAMSAMPPEADSEPRRAAGALDWR